MDKFATKIACFVVALRNAYLEEDDREELPPVELKEDELTEDFTAMLYAMYNLYRSISDGEEDIIGFTHILNRLAIQNIMKKEED